MCIRDSPNTLFEQTFVDIAFGIGLHAGPVLGVYRIDDSLGGAWRGFGILPGLFEDRPEHPGLLAQFIENLAVVSFEFFAVALQQAGPIETFGHADLFVVRRLKLLAAIFRMRTTVIENLVRLLLAGIDAFFSLCLRIA